MVIMKKEFADFNKFNTLNQRPKVTFPICIYSINASLRINNE